MTVMTLVLVLGWVVVAAMFVVATWADRAETRARVAAVAVR